MQAAVATSQTFVPNLATFFLKNSNLLIQLKLFYISVNYLQMLGFV